MITARLRPPLSSKRVGAPLRIWTDESFIIHNFNLNLKIKLSLLIKLELSSGSIPNKHFPSVSAAKRICCASNCHLRTTNDLIPEHNCILALLFRGFCTNWCINCNFRQILVLRTTRNTMRSRLRLSVGCCCTQLASLKQKSSLEITVISIILTESSQ